MLYGFRHVDVRDFRAGIKHLVWRQAKVRFRKAVTIIVTAQLQDGLLRFRRRVVDNHVHQKAVQLGFGQRVGTFLLNGILGGHHQEQPVQRKRAHPDADLAFTHGLEKGRLHLGRRTVDFIRKHQVVEDGAALEFELPGFRAVDFTAHNV